MTSNLLEQDRELWHRQRGRNLHRGAWVVGGLFALAGAVEIARAASLASQWQISFSEAVELIRLFESPPIERACTGYEVALIERILSALVEFGFSTLMILVGFASRRARQTTSRLWARIDDLENRKA